MFNCEIIYILSTNNMSNDNEVTIQYIYEFKPWYMVQMERNILGITNGVTTINQLYI